MTVYSFACSTPDDWSNWHLWVKTFGPGIITACVTGSIASAAYIVARTQREIASNKYKLDLFDKRWSVFEEFYDIYNNIEKAKKNNIVNHSNLVKEKPIFDKCLLKIYKVYDCLAEYNLTNEYKILILEIENLDIEISEIKNERLGLFVEFYNLLQPEELDEIDEIRELDDKVNEKENIKTQKFESFINEFTNLYKDMEEQLKVPHNPY